MKRREMGTLPLVHARGVAGLVLALGLSAGLTACSDESEPVLAPPLETDAAAPQGYDPDLEPARAVLPLVPAEATRLEVTDYDRVRLELGFDSVTATAGERAAFWEQAGTSAPLLDEGLLATGPQGGLTRDDVAWEARFTTPSGEGWVIGLVDGVPASRAEAASASGGPLAGAEVDAENLLLMKGAAPDVDSSWAADADVAAVVADGAAQATYASTDCVSTEVTGDTTDLVELGPFSVSYGGRLATVRLGELREDVFDRAKLDAGPEFDRALTDAVADPGTGRIGYAMGDPALAAELAVTERLPFAVCA